MLAHPAKECISCNVCVCVCILFSLPLSPPPSLPPARGYTHTHPAPRTGDQAHSRGVGSNATLPRGTRNTSDKRHLRSTGARRPGTLAPSCRTTLQNSRDPGAWLEASIRMPGSRHLYKASIPRIYTHPSNGHGTYSRHHQASIARIYTHPSNGPGMDRLVACRMSHFACRISHVAFPVVRNLVNMCTFGESVPSVPRHRCLSPLLSFHVCPYRASTWALPPQGVGH